MDEEMKALTSRETWKLVSAPTDVGCRWVFTLKYCQDGSVDRYKARLVVKGYTQTYDIDYFETFSLVARMNSIRILYSMKRPNILRLTVILLDVWTKKVVTF